MSHALLLLLIAASAPAAPADANVADLRDVSDVVEVLMASSRDAVRVCVAPLGNGNKDVEAVEAVEKSVVRALVDRHREDVVSPAYMRGKNGHRDVGEEALRSLTSACDHLVLGGIEENVLRLRIVLVATGEVLATSSVPVVPLGAPGAPPQAPEGARPPQPQRQMERLVHEIAWGVERTGEEVRLHRIAVAPMRADDEAKSARIDRYAADTLTAALRERGFLVVERAALDETMAQQALDETKAGQLLGAQSVATGSLASTGATFTLTVRVVSVETGAVLATSTASLARASTVAMADVETRTPFEAAVRSAVAPGWGQAYNRRGDKALVFAIAGYGSAITAASLGVGGAVAHARYEDPAAFDDLPPADRPRAATDAKLLADGLYVSAIVAAAAAAGVWSLGIVDAIMDAP